jgi:hypothetical protein
LRNGGSIWNRVPISDSFAISAAYTFVDPVLPSVWYEGRCSL